MLMLLYGLDVFHSWRKSLNNLVELVRMVAMLKVYSSVKYIHEIL